MLDVNSELAEELKEEIEPTLPPELETPSETPDMPSEKTPKRIPIKGPVFVSLERYDEVKGNLSSLNSLASDLRMTIENLKVNKTTGAELLNNVTENLDQMEKKLDRINSILKA